MSGTHHPVADNRTEENIIRNANRNSLPIAGNIAQKHGQGSEEESGRQHKRRKKDIPHEEVINSPVPPKPVNIRHTIDLPNFGSSLAPEAEADARSFHSLGTNASTVVNPSSGWSSDETAEENNSMTSSSIDETDTQLDDSGKDVSRFLEKPSHRLLTTKDPVIEPERLRAALARMNVHLRVDAFEILRKDVVFQTSTPPAGSSWNIQLDGSHHKVKAYADFLFVTDTPEQAFPLYLLVWLILREEVGYDGLKDLIRCWRSAIRQDDRHLIESLITQELDQSPLLQVAEPVLFIALTELVYLEWIDNNAIDYDEMRRLLKDRLNGAERQLSRQRKKTSFIDAVFGEPLELDLSRPSEFHELGSFRGYLDGYVDSDILLAAAYLAHHNCNDIDPAVFHIRNCLARVIDIIDNPIYDVPPQRYSLDDKSDYRPLFLFFIMNWSARPYEHENLDMETQNSFTGMSTVEIVSVITWMLVTKEPSNAIKLGGYNNKHGLKRTASDLLRDSNDTLLLGFLLVFFKSSRERLSEDRIPLFEPDFGFNADEGYLMRIATESIMRNAQKKRLYQNKGARESVLTIASENPTLAPSCSTSSTLSSMRRQSRRSPLSFLTRWSNRKNTVDELSERSSLLSISDGPGSRPMSGFTINTTEEAERSGLWSPLLEGTE